METKKLGLFACTAIVSGNMMGSGIALLPASLAQIGAITVISWILAIIGALCLAFVYARLGTLNPQAGGPIAYAEEVSPILGYQTGSLYFNANWVGNTGIAIAGVAYLSTFWPILNHPIPAGIASIAIIWVFILINCFGAHWIGRLTTLGVILLLIPVLITGVGGWFFFHPALFKANWNITHHPDYHAVSAGVLLCLWSFIGLESASTDAALTRDPEKTIPRSTMLGVSIAAIVYILSSTVMFGMFHTSALATAGSPFALSTAAIVGKWATPFVSAFIAFACLTSLGSWVLLVSQAAARSADDGILPKFYGKMTRKGIPVISLVSTGCLMSILMIIIMLFSKNSSQIFSHIISIAVLLTILPYFYSVLNFFHVAEMKGKQFFQAGACIIAAIFCFAAFAGASDVVLIATVILSLCTLIFYERKNRHPFEKKIAENVLDAEKHEGIDE